MPVPNPEVQRYVGLLKKEINLTVPTHQVTAQEAYNMVNNALTKYNNGES